MMDEQDFRIPLYLSKNSIGYEIQGKFRQTENAPYWMMDEQV